MKVLNDFRGLAIRLTGERLAHILEHPEMAEMEAAIALHPERVVQSFTDPEARLDYRFFVGSGWATSTCASSSRRSRVTHSC
jgi:hypothetical protein